MANGYSNDDYIERARIYRHEADIERERIYKHEADIEHRFEGARLYLAALKGDWKSVKNVTDIKTRRISRIKETTLHIAAAANQKNFVKKLVEGMNSNDLKVENTVGSTPLCYAAITGNVNIAKAILQDQNEDLLNPDRGLKPLIVAALFGNKKMVKHLSPLTTTVTWNETEMVELFVAYARIGMYGEALEMLQANPNLATSRNDKRETALHVLARNPSAFASGSQPGILRRHINSWMKIKQDQNSKQTTAHQLLKEICVWAYKSDHVENLSENERVISQQLLVAAKEGNVEFLIEVIRMNINLLLIVDTNKRTIFHIAVEERHKSIFNILNEIGSIKDLIFQNITKDDGNNILHLAAKSAAQHKLNAISGAALQMQEEFLWYKEVEKVVKPSFKEMTNKKKKTPYVLFQKEHEKLRKDGEKWMRDTASSYMLVATLIGGIMYSGQQDDHSSEESKVALAYSVSSAIALLCSSTSLIMFLSILTSGYSYHDFRLWLPIKLMIGVTSLFISISTMMVAFCASYYLKYHKHQRFTLMVVLFGLFACLPILYGLLTKRLLYDIFRSTYCFSSLFQPRQRLVY